MLCYVYIARCADGTLYTGWTNNLSERIKTHNNGMGAKYTRSCLPVDLVHWEVFDDKSLALKREFTIKKLTREQKEKLIAKR
jgi:putative endonuclease